jgi:uncharacterized lipoprotein YddW (UPF0748 family)
MRTPVRRRIEMALAVGVLLAGLALLVPQGVRWLVGGGPQVAQAAPAGADQAVAAVCDGQPVQAPYQLRGMTITTVHHMDWPSSGGLDREAVQAEYQGWLDLARRLNLNAVFVQIRPGGDAFWPSAYAPWSQWLTGRLDGWAPGWDPLAFMVAATHAANLQFYAWFNPYRADQAVPEGPGGDLAKLPADHPLREHPQWAVAYPAHSSSSRLYYDPGNPDARRFVEDSILDAVNRYDLDGVFFDDFFYPYPQAGQDFGDAASFARYGTGFASRADWRRSNVDTLVREVSQRVKAAKPWVRFGISPFGIWRNQRTDPLGSPTRGLQSYDEIYVDSRRWVREQWVDFIAPQLYWSIGNPPADYAALVRWWSTVVAGTRVQLYIAHADYRVGDAGVWRDPTELDQQLSLDTRYPVSGSLHFSARDLLADRLGAVTRYRAVHFAQPALVPRMAWLPAAPPAAPVGMVARREGTGAITLTWRAGPGRAPTEYAVYRADQDGRVAGLQATMRATAGADQRWTDPDVLPGRTYRYCVAGLDRNGNPGRLAPATAATG